MLTAGMEVTPGFEPGNQGFADPCLTTWLCHRLEEPNKNKPSRYDSMERTNEATDFASKICSKNRLAILFLI